MGRRYRKTQQVTSCQDIELGTADGDVTIPIQAPSAGAIVDRIIITDQIAGTTTDGSYTLILEEVGTAIAHSGTITMGEVDAGVGTIVTAPGLGTLGATAEGTMFQFQVTEVDTVTTTVTVAVTIWWIT